MSEHTQTPWTYLSDGKNWRIVKPDGVKAMAGSIKPEFQTLTVFPIHIGEVHAAPYNAYNGDGRDHPEIGEANAAFIVQACNSYDALVEALSIASHELECSGLCHDHPLIVQLNKVLSQARNPNVREEA